MGLLIFAIIMFVGLIVVHEYGHFIMARRNGVDVEEFGIGFPPRLWAKKVTSKRGTYDFSLNALPLGGFVKLKGENDAETEKGSFGAAPLRTKVKIMVAGVIMNLLTAFALFTLVALVGMPKIIDNQFTVKSDTKVMRQEVLVAYVEPGSPAEKSGIEERDTLLTINGKEIKIADELPTATQEFAGQEVVINYLRDGQEKTAAAQLRTAEEVETSRDTNEPKGYLGVGPAEYTLQRSTWSAPVVAAGLISQFTTETLKGLGGAIVNLFQGEGGKASEQVAGPVGIFVILRDGSLLGYQFVLLIIAVISLTLAIMNVLPIPALDGGRLFVTLLFRAIRKPLSQDLENMIHGIGFAALMLLFIVITVVDVRRFF